MGALAIVVWILRQSAYGIDFTDESFYLVWISNPFIYKASLTQFGFIYHPLYLLVDGNIAHLRLANILITFCLAWSMCGLLLSYIVPECKNNAYSVHVISAGLATSSLIYFDLWLPTPSYNSLALQALMLTSIGLLSIEKQATRRSVLGWVAVGAGGWLAFMAKPSTALALAVGVSCYLIFSKKFSTKLFLVSLLSASLLMVAAALAIDGSILVFFSRILLGMELGSLLNGGHAISNLLRFDELKLDLRLKAAMILVAAVCATAAWGLWRKSKAGISIGGAVSLTFFCVTSLLAFGELRQDFGLGPFPEFLVFGVVFSLILTGLITSGLRSLKEIAAPRWAMAAFFFAMPYIYAFGTSNNYWQSAGSASIFWLFGGLIFIGPFLRKGDVLLLAMPFVLATQAITASLLQAGFENPYRQPQPLRLNSVSIAVGDEKSRFILSQDYAGYINRATTAAKNAGFEEKNPVIDLTGKSPGILYALKAESIGQAWTIGGYPGSLNLAKASLDLVSCDKIAQAWILYEPGGQRNIPEKLMQLLGANFPKDYDLAGSWPTAKGASGLSDVRTQELYKPIAGSSTLRACNAMREHIKQ